jgi:hypothetical protein
MVSHLRHQIFNNFAASIAWHDPVALATCSGRIQTLVAILTTSCHAKLSAKSLGISCRNRDIGSDSQTLPTRTISSEDATAHSPRGRSGGGCPAADRLQKLVWRLSVSPFGTPRAASVLTAGGEALRDFSHLAGCGLAAHPARRHARRAVFDRRHVLIAARPSPRRSGATAPRPS